MSLLSFRDVVAERAACLEPLVFIKRQSRFLTTVMAHSGVFLERQYCRFAGIAHGQKSHDFLDRLVQRGFARVAPVVLGEHEATHAVQLGVVRQRLVERH